MKVLDRCWVNCLRMWKWLSENLPEGFLEKSNEEKEDIVDFLKNQWLEENEGEKLVLFAEHKAMIKVLRNRCRGKYLVVDGSTPTKLRYEYEQQFQKDKSIRLFIANRRAGGVGLTLTAASALAFTEMDWVPGNHTQAEDRIHRIGQEQVAWIYYFVAMGSIEEKLCVIIQSKQKVLDAILDGGKVNDRLNVYDKLMASYKNNKVA